MKTTSIPSSLPLSRDDLAKAIENGFKPKSAFFWGNTPSEGSGNTPVRLF